MVCILLMKCIIGGTFLLRGFLFSQSVSTILQLVVGLKTGMDFRGLKTGGENGMFWSGKKNKKINKNMFWSEIGPGFGEPDGRHTSTKNSEEYSTSPPGTASNWAVKTDYYVKNTWIVPNQM